MRQKKCLGSEKTRVAIVPGELTKILQPLDLCIDLEFKALISYQRESWMSAENHASTKEGWMRKDTYTKVCR